MRRSNPLLVLLVCACSKPAPSPESVAPAAEAQAAETKSVCTVVEAPSTPAGAQLVRFIAAVDAKDDTLAQEFVAKETAAEFRDRFPQAQHLQFIRSLHGDEPASLCRIELATNEEIAALLGGHDDRDAPQYGRVILRVDGDGKVAMLGLEPAQPEDLTRPLQELDAAAISTIVEDVAKGLEDYVHADKRDAMAAHIRAAAKSGEYGSITSPRALAQRLTDDLRSVSHDKHLGVLYSASKLGPPPPEEGPTPEEIGRFKQQAEGDGFGIAAAEVRDGNIGYLDLRGFLPPEIAGDAIAAAMTKLADTDVLVIDLRNNGGGDPSGVARVSSYLFDKRVHLNDLYTRSEDRTESYHTTPEVAGKRFGGKKPIYVLTSSRTFSAGEEFAYNLRALKRATLVGETTGGGAHPTKLVPVSDHWGVFVPFARAVNPVTKTNWEGTGVKPHVEVPAAQALDRALELAAKRKKSR